MLRSVKYGLYAAVLAGLVAVPVVWNSVDKSVKLTVDGKTRTITTTASSVSDLLGDHGLKAGSHDLLAPTGRSEVKDGMQIVLRRGRLLHLNVDGQATSIWTTAPTVQVALSQLGYSTSDFVSVSRSRRLPLDPTAIAIRTPRLMTVVHDGERETVSTTEPTVARLLAQIKVVPDADDKLSVAPTVATRPGMTVVLQRVGVKTENKTVKLSYPTTRKNDDDLTKGDTKVIKPGRNGQAQVTYSVTYVDGKATTRQKVRTVTLTAPSTKIVAVGTKKVKILAADAGTPDPGSAKAIAKELAAKRGWGDDQYDCLVSMWNKESGWRVNAANPSGAYGIPQALPGSKMSSAGDDWQSNAETQIKWGLKYISARYDTPCGAWSFWQAHNYY